jgi:hypothetical protein
MQIGFVWVCFYTAKSSNFTYLLVIKELKPIAAFFAIGFELALYWLKLGLIGFFFA